MMNLTLSDMHLLIGNAVMNQTLSNMHLLRRLLGGNSEEIEGKHLHSLLRGNVLMELRLSSIYLEGFL